MFARRDDPVMLARGRHRPARVREAFVVLERFLLVEAHLGQLPTTGPIAREYGSLDPLLARHALDVTMVRTRGFGSVVSGSRGGHTRRLDAYERVEMANA